MDVALLRTAVNRNILTHLLHVLVVCDVIDYMHRNACVTDAIERVWKEFYRE